MTENSDPFPEESHDLPEAVLLKLPPELARTLHQHSSQVGQSLANTILAILRSALELSASASEDNPLQPSPLQPSQPVRSIEERLNHLEAMLPRLETLEGKWMAF
jgi:hypothetical protein